MTTEQFQWGSGYILDTGEQQVNPESSERAARRYVENCELDLDLLKVRGGEVEQIRPRLFVRAITYGPWVAVEND